MIRNFEIKDLNEINKLLNNFEYKINDHDLNNEFLRILVYEENNLIKGVMVYSIYYERVEIDYIIVDENYRRKGIATKLLNYLEATNNNLENITLEVRKSNKCAINFYKKNSFIEISIRKNYYKNEDGILMMKKLGE